MRKSSIISIYKRLISVDFKFVYVINNKFVNVTLFDIARLINLLNLSRLFIKNLYVIFLNFELFHFLYVSLLYNFVNYKAYFALFNVIKITLFESLFNVLNYFLYRNIEYVSRLNNNCFNILCDHFSYNRIYHFINYFKYIYINTFTFDISRKRFRSFLKFNVFHYSFLFIFDDNNFKRRVLLIRQ